jgi:hypothetical protein
MQTFRPRKKRKDWKEQADKTAEKVLKYEPKGKGHLGGQA